MPIQPQPLPEATPPEREGAAFGPGPFSASDVRTLFTAIDIYRTIGRLEHAVESLESATKSHAEKLQQLIQKTDQTAFAVPVMENAIARHEKDLNQLGKIAHTAKTLGNIALVLTTSCIGVAILIYLYHHFAPLFFSK
jgi:hypothetical protein